MVEILSPVNTAHMTKAAEAAVAADEEAAVAVAVGGDCPSGFHLLSLFPFGP